MSGFIQTRRHSGYEREFGNKINARAYVGDARAYKAVRAGGEVAVDVHGLLGMIDKFDRPANAFVEGAYTNAGMYADGFENKPGKRLPKAGMYAEAGLGRAHAEWCVLEADAKGPNTCAGVHVSLEDLGAKAFFTAELVSAEASVGPVKFKAGIGFNMGAGISAAGVEAKFLGTGFSFGNKVGVSLFGSEIEVGL